MVRRVATERNMGLLHRMAAAQGGGGMSISGHQPLSNGARSDFYTIRSHDRVEEDEFVDQDVPQAAAASVVDESAELEALKAVTDQAASVYGSSSGGASSSGGPIKSYVAGGGGPNNNGRGGGPPQFGKPPPHMMQQGQQPRPTRPNADPELRQQELPKKKTTTGIPRTFLSLNAPAPTPAEGEATELTSGDAENGETTAGGLASQLNPNQHVFQALINRAGGQSMGDSAGKRRDLDYALKLTATSIPEHLQCGICHSVVKNAMLVPCELLLSSLSIMLLIIIRHGIVKGGTTLFYVIQFISFLCHLNNIPSSSFMNKYTYLTHINSTLTSLLHHRGSRGPSNM